MPVTITRTPWIDDDGTGTTGTVINNAVKTGLYNEIDGALAKVAQLTGGNTLTGTQVLSGIVLVNIPTNNNNAQMFVTFDQTVRTYGLSLFGSGAGFATYVQFANNGLASAGSIVQTGPSTVAYNTSSDARLKDDEGRAVDVSALRALVIHDFTWKADGTRARGVFAQEAHRVAPTAVTAGTDETTETGALARPWMTDYSKFVPDLIVGWQQHDAELQALRALVALSRID